jgi:hypothetical protein
MAVEVTVRCVGTPIQTGGREDPTEVDLIQPCGWEGVAPADLWARVYDADKRCPQCHGAVEVVTGADVTGPAGATTPTGPPAGPPDLCTCGHPADTHPLIRTICTTCGWTRLSNGQNAPNGFCMGWPYELPVAPAGPLDLDHAIQAAPLLLAEAVERLRSLARGAGWGLTSGHSRDAQALEAGADAVERVPQLERDLRAAQTQVTELRDTLAELFDLLHVLTLSPKEQASVNVRDPKTIEARVRAALDRAATRETTQ